MLSRYAKSIQIKEGVWAVFNSLLMAPVFVNNEELSNIFAEQVSAKEYVALSERGIYVAEVDKDDLAFKELVALYESHQEDISILYLIAATGCNLRCKYCFVEDHEKDHIHNELMSYETAVLALDKFYAYTNGRVSSRTVIFYGGEPFLNSQMILDVVKYSQAQKQDLNFSVVTNATLLSDDLISELAKCNISLGISIDGPEFIQDRYRVSHDGSGTYNIVQEAIRKLKLAGVPFNFSITLSEGLLEHSEDLLSWIKLSGVSSISYNLLHYASVVSEAEYERYYKTASNFLIQSFHELAPLGIYEERLNRKIKSFVNQSFRFSDCGAVSASQLTVKPNGKVCVCHAYAKNPDDDLGSITDSISFLLNSQKNEKWKKMSSIYKSECQACNAISICGTGCSLQSKALFGDMLEIDRPFCIHTKTSLVWLLRELYEKSSHIK